MKFVLLIFLSYSAVAQTEIEDAKKSIYSLIRPLLAGQSNARPKGLEKFRTDGCEKTKINWMDVMLQRSTATMNFKFKEGCDIQGVISPKVFQWFPAELELRNIQSYTKVKSSNRVMAELETKPIMNLEMREGLLTGKKSVVKFEADYRVRMNPGQSNPVSENLGGELRISEINGKKVSIKEKILVK